LPLQLALGSALIAVNGWAAPEVERVFTRAHELGERKGDSPELFAALNGLWAMHYQRAELRTAYEFAEQLLRRAQNADNPALLILAHIALGISSVHIGQLLPGRKYLEKAFSLYRECQRSLDFRFGGMNAGVHCLSYGAFTLWNLGYADQALQRANEGVALAQGLSNPFSLPFAEYFLGLVRVSRGDARAVHQTVERLIALAAEHGFPFWLPRATMLRGWAMAEEGHNEEGISLITEGLAALRATGAEMTRPGYLCMLANTYGDTGRFDDGLSALAEALAVANEHELAQPDIYRLKGELLLKQNNSNAAEAQSCFERAIEIARTQSAKSQELRATMSLARLLAQDKRDEARAMLADIYGWFTEGFDTADLKDAKALLEELSE
jgi:predicted ATPase